MQLHQRRRKQGRKVSRRNEKMPFFDWVEMLLLLETKKHPSFYSKKKADADNENQNLIIDS